MAKQMTFIILGLLIIILSLFTIPGLKVYSLIPTALGVIVILIGFFRGKKGEHKKKSEIEESPEEETEEEPDEETDEDMEEEPEDEDLEEETKYCRKCGEEIEINAKKCPECGGKQ